MGEMTWEICGWEDNTKVDLKRNGARGCGLHSSSSGRGLVVGS
jgi:hypothetical protein